MPTSVLTPPAANKPGDRRYWHGLVDAAQSLAIARAGLQHRGLSLVIAASAKSAALLENELKFFTAGEDIDVFHFPDWETLPYDLFSPHQDIVSQRLLSLFRLPRIGHGFLVVPITSLMHRLPPPEFVAGHSFVHQVGESLDIDRWRLQLENAGYHCVETVYEHGEFAVRGSLLDVFPMGSELPFRIDLFDDEIESLRTFDPESQRTLEQKTKIQLLPAREFPLDKQAIKRFLDNWHTCFDVDPRQCPTYQDIKAGLASQGVEYYLPLFFEHTATLFDYLPDDTIMFTEGGLLAPAEAFWHEVNERYTEYGVDPQRPLLPPGRVFVPPQEVFAGFKQMPRTELHGELQENKPGTGFDSRQLPDIAVDNRAANPLHRLIETLDTTPCDVLFCAESPGRREVLLELLGQQDIQPREVRSWKEFMDATGEAGGLQTAIAVYPLERGMELEGARIRLISETELFGRQVLQKRRRSRQREFADQAIKNLTELREGAPVVHIDHGVGRYRGLETITVDNAPQEFLTLEYADASKLYVPVASLHLITRYSGADETLAPLHRLGSEHWQKAKDKAAREARDTAAELLDVYARRAARTGFACPFPADSYQAFAAGFPFEETPDQLDAIEAVKRDMMADQPMDRLVCGDVGFGKTEVAMRAAFLAVSAGKQVVMLVPTTLLAQQHYENFRDRFANWAVNIEVLSRFRSRKEQDHILEQVAAGKTDILIGTHKLLQGKVTYKNLGLLIIDEEHRFGVQQKEKIKALRAQVDILTLTATPIPRTLNMAMGGIRDLSIIATAPARRLSVKTFIRQSESRIVREAILREIFRGGQVYFLHNEVKSIEKATRELRELMPEARIAFAHGQMRERELEKAMSDFYHQRFNVLVCSTIIETGIDIPSANTIIIERADKLGLAQLHQLRGRVGRSHHQAYAYLLTPDPRAMTADAEKRLEAIAAADHLGSGFTLATHDMEIRGAGELLGEGQSGHIHGIGFSLYMELLERAVKALKKGETPELDLELAHGVEVNLRIPALIPEDYLPDVHARLTLYKRLAGARNSEELRELQVEMVDRFGLLPEPLKNLVRVTELRLRLEALGIARLEAGPNGGRLEFEQHTKVEPLTIVQLVQKEPDRYRLQGATELRFSAAMQTSEQRFRQVGDILDTLTPGQQQVA